MRPRVRAKFKRISGAAVASLIESVERVATVVRDVPELFTYERDPNDAHYINLALAMQAKYVISRDHDLLDLMNSAHTEAKEFRRLFSSLEIIDPPQFLRELDASASQA